jgi:hypothetical protein
MSDVQFFKLQEISSIYIMLDSPRKDPNAVKQAVKIADRFQELLHHNLHLVVIPDGDPGSWPRSELRKFIDESEPYSPTQRLLAFTK